MYLPRKIPSMIALVALIPFASADLASGPEIFVLALPILIAVVAVLLAINFAFNTAFYFVITKALGGIFKAEHKKMIAVTLAGFIVDLIAL